MVSKITILEPHFDGAQFGPVSIDGEPVNKNDTIETTGEVDQAVTKSRKTLFAQGMAGFVLMFVVLYVSLRVLTGGGGGTE